MSSTARPQTLRQLRESGWKSRTVKEEIRENFLKALQTGENLFPGIIGYEDTVLPEISIAMLAGHDLLFLGEKGQAKSRLMRSVMRFLDEGLPYLDIPGSPVHEDPYAPITKMGKEYLAEHGEGSKIAYWPREQRYAERLAPGTKFADIIGEIDPAKLAGGTSLSAEEALHFGLIPRMHRGIFGMNEIPELDELIQVGLFNILEERDVQIRGYPIQFDLDVLIMFSANPATYNRSGKVIPQLKDRIGSLIQTHYPRQRSLGIEIMEQEAGPEISVGDYPVVVPYFMKEIIEEISVRARKSKYIDQQSGVSARFSLANYRTMIASARHRGVRLNEKPAVPRISDLGHLPSSSLGKLELDMMGSNQMSERQVLDAIIAEAIAKVFAEYVSKHGLDEISDIFSKGVKIEVGDMLPSSAYAARLKRVPKVWDKAFEVNTGESEAMRASCVEFVLAGLHATDKISRSARHGIMTYET